MSLRNWIFIVLFFITLSSVFSQEYSVASFQKINATNGNFSSTLNNEDLFGIAIDNIGDLDGNGVNDLIVGAPNDDDGGTNHGAVYILFLDNNNQVISETKISDTQGNFTGILENNDRFGGGVSYLGDMNGDGLIEVSVTADYDGDGGFWHGAFYIISLNSDGTVNSFQKISDTEGGFTGVITADAIFGTDVTNIGDMNGDGIDDLAVGSRRDNDGGTNRGAVWILFMNNDFTVNNFQKISDTQGGFTGVLEFEDFFGGSVASLGDLDGDGVTDIIVGSYRDDDSIQNSGSFYVLFLNPNGTVKSHQKVSNLFGNLSTTMTVDALFGESIDGVMDIDNDGRIEVLVGALRQNNPSLGTQTGAFFLIELNNDGTVSEEHIYTYGENCFSGELNSGDFFGGAVSILEDSNGQVSFAAGAYRDSENGLAQGAVWILDLGEINYQIQSTTDASQCDLSDGSFTISELTPNVNYNITYTFEGSLFDLNITSSASGTITISNLATGGYENIMVTETAINCQDDLGTVFIDAAEFSLTYTGIDPSSCGLTDGQIIISDLAPNELYVVDYFYNSNQFQNLYTSNADGEIILTGLSAGDYTNMMVISDQYPCSDGIGLIQLEGAEFNASIQSSDVSSCDLSDGSITFSNLSPNAGHTITYDFNGNPSATFISASDSMGELSIVNLTAGTYSNIVITESSSGCQANFGPILIEELQFNPVFSRTNPSCGLDNGSIQISNLESEQEYSVSYTLNGNLVQFQMNSNTNGQIQIMDLSAGLYENVSIEDPATTCSEVGPSFELLGTQFNALISFTNNTTCSTNDGTITFSGLLNNSSYTITLNYDGSPSVSNIESDDNGTIMVSDLPTGNYTNIVITENATGCVDQLGDISLICEIINNDCFRVKDFFTPNNDGINDVWNLDMIAPCEYTLNIHDRYGKILAILDPSNPDWDGTYDGRLMPKTDYWFKVEFITPSNTTRVLRGHFSLLR